VQFGIHVRPNAESMDVRDLGRAVEDLGFDSLWLPEHTHMPVGGASVHPDGERLMDSCRRLLDPLVALAAVGAVTTRLRLGTGVLLLPQRDPILLAKEVATLDLLSGGRVLLGVGAGWNREETANHGVDPDRRFAVMRERVLAMRRIWTEDEAAFAGEWVRFGPLWSWPKPTQQPHPPVLVGGEGPRVLERVVEYGDAWLPNEHPGVEARLDRLRELAAARGRDPIPVTLYGVEPDPVALRRYADLGVERCVFVAPSAPAAETLPALARLARVAGVGGAA
jgi:probable F420-dependent oxidoreductase